jgi:hypothetical protein
VSWGNPNALADALGYLGEAVRLQRPTEGERALLAALAAGANAGNILNTLLEHALPRNCQVIENSPLLFFFLSEPFLFLLITM